MSGEPLRILTVCTHNRTRSVMTAAMIQSLLDDRLGGGAAVVRSAGFGPPDMPAIPDAVDAMQRRGLDVSRHRSRQVTADVVEPADLILTAERDHVVRIATISRDTFGRAMTLPEFLTRSAAHLGRDDLTLAEWSAELTADRTAGEYLRADVPEIADPTGSAPRIFEAAVVEMERDCVDVAGLITAFGRPS